MTEPYAVQALAAIVTWHGRLSDPDFYRLVQRARIVMERDYPELLKQHRQEQDRIFETEGAGFRRDEI